MELQGTRQGGKFSTISGKAFWDLQILFWADIFGRWATRECESGEVGKKTIFSTKKDHGDLLFQDFSYSF